MMWTWASETEWTRLECPEKALYTDVTLKNYGNAMALRFSVYKTEVISHLESGEALCIWAGQRTLARVWRVVQEGKGEKEVHTTGCYIVSLNVHSEVLLKKTESSPYLCEIQSLCQKTCEHD
ncbi:zinc finger protein 140-like [Mirounga leonina]|uniref:zinc finger protein 140-like n=1 Tax=Mirounga leonina TaxID=9715 RepID=UPI00156C182A|nr:zinc finger protein 140-like [Mirounga leonina]